ncbi:MAG TPA: hypothetical protein PKC45_12835, partial [Gemmatales bacterium]|nr:hypothetical protein [Gemmatales bacterium]
HEQTQTSATPRPGRLSARWSRQRPPMSGRRPLHWKERGASALWSRLLWLVGGGVVVILPTIWGLNASDRGGLLLDDEARRLALLFTLPALLVPMLLTASRAAWSLRGEADRATWDALLATPLQLRDILWAKWQGSVLGVVQPLIILGLVGGWGAAVAGTIARSRFRSYYRGIEVPGWNSLQAIALLLLNCLVAVILAAGVGLLMSVINRSVLRAYVSTFFTLSLYCGLPLLLSYLVFGLMRSWGASALVVLLDIFESSIYLGLPLMLVLSLGFLSARLRRGMGLVLRVVAVPVLIVLVLQVPMILLGTFLVIATMKSRGGDILLLLSPPGFVLDLVDRWLSVGVYYRGLQSFMFESEAEVAPYVIALSVQLVAACLVWFIARRWACYKSERIGDHWRSQRPRPVPPPEPSRPERVAS